jgi:lipoate-protein ligase A
MDLDLDSIAGALRTPLHGHPAEARAALGERIAGLKDLLGAQPDPSLVRRNIGEAFESEFGVEFSEGDLTLSEHARYEAALREVDTPDWVNLVARPAAESALLEGVHRGPGKVLRAHAIVDLKTRTLRQIWFTGDPGISPQRTVADLEAALRDVPVDGAARKIELFFAGRQAVPALPAAADFTAAMEAAIRQPLFVKDA